MCTKNILSRKCPICDDFTAELCQIFRINRIIVCTTLSKNQSRRNLFYKASNTLIPKPIKDNMGKKQQATVFDEHRYKIPQ